MYFQFIRFTVLSLSLIAGVLARTQPARAQQTLHVCAENADTGRGLRGAEVLIVTALATFTETTGNDGCAHIRGEIPVSVDDPVEQPDRLSLDRPFPNPTGSRVAVPVQGAAGSFQIFDLQGRRREVSVERRVGSGAQAFIADLSGLPDGLYLYRVSGETGTGTGRVIKLAGSASLPAANGLENALLKSAQTAGNGGGSADSIRIEVSLAGFVDVVEKRVVRNGEVVNVQLSKLPAARIPLIDLNESLYLGQFEGGLYPDRQNEMPAAHFEAGLEIARRIEPLDLQGRPSPSGKVLFISIGMSTTSSVFCGVAEPTEPCKEGTFMEAVAQDAGINDRLVLIDGADPGKTADEWEDPDLRAFRRVEEEELTPFGHSENQVQVAWVKLASSRPSVSLPEPAADAFMLTRQIGNAMRALRARYPNLKLVFFSSRVYGGYAVTDINPEPYAYESGFAAKWVIEAQLRQMYEAGAPVDLLAGDLNYEAGAPWLAWGPYYWADGRTPRSDGLVWVPDDLKGDGTHLARQGIEKITALLLDFFRTSPHVRCWYLENGVCE